MSEEVGERGREREEAEAVKLKQAAAKTLAFLVTCGRSFTSL